MRIRTIKPEFYKHDVLFDLVQETGFPLRIAFTGLWCSADREGRFKWKPRRLKAEILPYDELDFSRVLDALVTRGFIIKYTSNDEEFGYIPNFSKHQVINNRESDSILPNPDECEVLTREARVEHAACASPSGREGKGKEWNGTEGKGRSANALNKKQDESFETFWTKTNFPKRPQDTKGDIKKKYLACIKSGLTPEDILFSSDVFAEVNRGNNFSIGMRKFMDVDTVKEYLKENVAAKDPEEAKWDRIRALEARLEQERLEELAQHGEQKDELLYILEKN